MTGIDPSVIRERLSRRAYGWSNTAGAPEPVREAAAAYAAAVNAMDDAIVDYELEEASRHSAIRKHNQAVTEALRAGKLPPSAKGVPSLEELEVKHAAILAAREQFVREAADTAERIAAQHYAAWRSTVLEQLQAKAAALTEATAAATQAAGDWGSAAQMLARLDRSWAPRTAQLDDASFLGLMDRWLHLASVESTQLPQNLARQTNTLRQLTEDPVVTEYDAARGRHQYTAGFLAQQSPGVREEMLRQAAASVPLHAA